MPAVLGAEQADFLNVCPIWMSERIERIFIGTGFLVFVRYWPYVRMVVITVSLLVKTREL